MWFKSKEDRKEELIQKVNALNIKYESYTNRCCIINNVPIKFLEFGINNNSISVRYLKLDTKKGYYHYNDDYKDFFNGIKKFIDMIDKLNNFDKAINSIHGSDIEKIELNNLDEEL